MYMVLIPVTPPINKPLSNFVNRNPNRLFWNLEREVPNKMFSKQNKCSVIFPRGLLSSVENHVYRQFSSNKDMSYRIKADKTITQGMFLEM